MHNAIQGFFFFIFDYNCFYICSQKFQGKAPYFRKKNLNQTYFGQILAHFRLQKI